MHKYKFTAEELAFAIKCLDLYIYNIKKLESNPDLESLHVLFEHILQHYFSESTSMVTFTEEQLAMLMDSLALGIAAIEYVWAKEENGSADHPVFKLYQRLGALCVGYYDEEDNFIYDPQKISQTEE